MVVETHDKHPGHPGVVGLHIGSGNVERYFPRNTPHVELELDHLRIVCGLDASFWRDRPEIFDLRLSSWLDAKRKSGKITASKASLALIPCGDHTFRLQVLSKEESDGLLANGNGVAVVSEVVTSLAAFDRRKRDVGHTPERRRVGRLKSDATRTEQFVHANVEVAVHS